MKHFSVSQICNYVKGLFDEQLVLQNIQIAGEVSEYKVSGNHTYFSLTDGDSSLACARYGQVLGLTIGAKYIVYGSLKFFAKNSRVSFSVLSARPFGEGELYINFLKLKQKLQDEGLFDNKRPLPKFVRRIAIVTSPTGAVISDFAEVVTRLNKCIDIVVIPTRVQGDGAESEIVSALECVSKIDGIDVAVIARGGGSASDLAVFNTERAARALAVCPVPTVSAIGHETDYTLCDFAADIRAGTPSIAAELIVPPYCDMQEAVLSNILSIERRLTELYCNSASKTRLFASQMISASRLRLDACENAAKRHITVCSHRVDRLYESAKSSFDTAAIRLNKSNPLALLDQGYARVSKDGKAVLKATELSKGDDIDIIMSGGKVGAQVK
ncbi:MAG: exodeoxyribonuclease VII large subunit [Firmicutes bacterium]|nr:exodeoxyribonuclease VII large subunit [Bacillota bacterium]